jgi:peptidoglycan/LPS O-acetylase OafA/YrhL
MDAATFTTSIRAPAVAAEGSRLAVLDGWRGISILLVLATHLLPLGPKAWQLNLTTGPLGMALFFTLSGFLITNFLLHHNSVKTFLIRRFFRILPLAWLCLAIGLPMAGAKLDDYPANFLFYANLPPFWLTPVTSHFWSLCVEMQFYIGVALLFLLLKERGLLLIPALCLLVTVIRVIQGAEVSIVSYLRVDEILAGAVLALAYNRKLGGFLPRLIQSSSPYLLFALLLISCHPQSGAANYLRPYLAALLVGTTLFNQDTPVASLLVNKVLVYVAAISFALYVIHPLLGHTWLGSGEGIEKYLKRPLLFGALFLCAHVSTFYYEQRWIAYGKSLASRFGGGN